MIDEIRGEHEFAATYGSPRVWWELRRPRRQRRPQTRGADHAREQPQGRLPAKGWKRGSTRQNPRHTAAPDLLGRDFTATAPNQKWVADLTRIPTGEGVLWLASVRDAFANKVVGWDSGPRDHRPGPGKPGEVHIDMSAGSLVIQHGPERARDWSLSPSCCSARTRSVAWPWSR